MRTKCAAYLVVVMLTGLAPALAAEQSGTVVRAIQIVEDGGVTSVTIDADGPLPLPVSEALTDPPRIYFDLTGVTHKVRATTVAQRGGIVSRVRVALRQASPSVTRVVLDLTRLESFSLHTDERQAGRIRVIVGSESATYKVAEPATRVAVPSPAPPSPAPPVSTNAAPASVAPAPTAGMPVPTVPASKPTPATVEGSGNATPTRPPAITRPSPARSPVLSPEPQRPALPVHEVQVYRKQIYGELARMEEVRALVGRIDAGENLSADTLTFVEKEFTELRRILEAVKPPAVLAVTHDLMMTSCTLGAMASRLGIEAAQDGNTETRRRAASAAAGALMLFDRACADIGCTRTPR